MVDLAAVDSDAVKLPLLGRCSRILCGCGPGLTAGPLMATSWSTKVYISNFHAPVTLLGILLIAVSVYDVLNIYPFAKWSDRGRANGWLFPSDSWGRRAPFATMGYPLLIVALFLVWVGPSTVEISGVAAAIWLFSMRFILATAATMYYMASSTSLYELFPSKDERTSVATYISLFALIGAMYGLVAVGAFVLSLSPGSTKERVTFFVVGLSSVVMTFGILPHISVMRSSCMVEPVKSPGRFKSVKVVWRSQSARNLLMARFLCLGSITVAISFMPFYLQYACNVSLENLGPINSLIIATNVFTRALMLPVHKWLVRRFCPSRGLMIAMIGATIVGTPFALVAYLTKDWRFLLILAFILGFNGGMVDIALRVLLGFVADQDQLTVSMQGRESSDDPSFIAPRRDGLFWSAWTLADVVAGMYTGVGTLIFGLAGFDAKYDDEGKSQPESAVFAITIFFLGVITVNYILTAVVLSRFPLKGERLKEVQARYEELFRALEISTSIRRSITGESSRSSSRSSRLSWKKPESNAPSGSRSVEAANVVIGADEATDEIMID